MRIAFLFNHDQIHQIAHSLPIALALVRHGFAGEVLIATTNSRLTTEVRRIGGEAIGTTIPLIELELSRGSRVIASTLGRVVPASKLLVYGDNLDFFRSIDVLVVAEKTSLVLKTYYHLDNLMIVHTRHGAGDRAIGFDKASARFDHVLCSGAKIRNRLIEEAHLSPDQVSVVGYPKFDLQGSKPDTPPGIEPDRPVVLYNPHPSPHLSSWYKHGRQVLDFFLRNDEFQLIFAPHVMLFERPFVLTIDRLSIDRPGHISDRYLRAPNIHIDLGSRASTDMRYARMADIYLGDVSSQVYEFLCTPRPCLFLNSHEVAWQWSPNYQNWRAGPVIPDPSDLGRDLRYAIETHARLFRPIQEAMFNESFDLTNEPSSIRAAKVISSLVDRPLSWAGERNLVAA